MADEDDGKEYRWETGYEKTWEAIKEDEGGLLESSVAEEVSAQRAKQRRLLAQRQHELWGGVRLGMMRHMYVIVDFSDAMADQDLKPTRYLCTMKLLEGFIEEYFDQNPISQMGIIITRNKRAEKICDLAGNPRKHIKLIQQLVQQAWSGGGEPSLQNALELAHSSLKLLPPHASREVLILLGSLTTCDPGDITATIELLRKVGIRCSVIGLAAEVHICKLLARVTGGDFGVALDDIHFRELLLQHVLPPPSATPVPSSNSSPAPTAEASLVKMGFPQHHVSGLPATDGVTKQPPQQGALTMCMCHLDAKEEDGGALVPRTTSGGYFCPQCCSKYCELPVECKACGLALVSAPHLARSYHHLFPVVPFTELPVTQESGIVSCHSCLYRFTQHDKMCYRCETCYQVFCLDCDLFIHDTMHVCPGCASNRQTYGLAGSGSSELAHESSTGALTGLGISKLGSSIRSTH
ncbi:general transcription factor IIH subunit 2 isoform X1 [Hetaerina americana]|uniref:general transcription factor IIH subunit 2 isoform X1 n=2 Tax=Hetaerina americana TaxID=62018 RepID=UPI003A7F627B